MCDIEKPAYVLVKVKLAVGALIIARIVPDTVHPNYYLQSKTKSKSKTFIQPNMTNCLVQYLHSISY